MASLDHGDVSNSHFCLFLRGVYIGSLLPRDMQRIECFYTVEQNHLRMTIANCQFSFRLVETHGSQFTSPRKHKTLTRNSSAVCLRSTLIHSERSCVYDFCLCQNLQDFTCKRAHLVRHHDFEILQELFIKHIYPVLGRK